ncbi:hypothetical protein B0O99DRAFT_652847 [Bisporella sp. PMI_857]|nr:hypothetical protein B0O99DRAFT_652847 [Bisporella sp. PMI_857]
MSSSTSLLPKDIQKKDDHPIFSRICHSPWISIGQKTLVILRLAIAIYSISSLISIVHFEVDYLRFGALVFFDFANYSWLLQVIYSIIAAIWTFMHLYYPEHEQPGDGSPGDRLQRFFSPPHQNARGCCTNNRIFFSIFHTSTVTYPFVVTFIYWAILVPQKKTLIPAGETFQHGWHTGFYLLHKYCINVLLAIIEVFFLSSITRQYPIWAHVNGLIVVSLIYVGWAFIGRYTVGRFTYYMFDHRLVGWEYVITAIVIFIALGQASLTVIHFLTRFREVLCSKCQERNNDYQRIDHGSD